MADRKTLWVMTSGGGWAVRWEGASSVASSHTTQSAAISVAKKQVGSMLPGSCSQIVVQGADGKIRTEWTYGKDPFPPAG